MTKHLQHLLIVAALATPGALALAADPAAEKADKAGEKALTAGAKAEKAAQKAETAGNTAEAAGNAAKKAGAEAQREADEKDRKFAREDASGVKEAREARGQLEKADTGLIHLFESAPGYAVFATVGKGAAGIGGAHGTGVLFEGGKATGKVTLTQVTVGLQLGGQAYSEVIFFETDKSLASFKKGGYSMAAQASAVAVKAGASASATYVNGVSVFTHVKGGAMAEASVGGQKLDFMPYERPVAIR